MGPVPSWTDGTGPAKSAEMASLAAALDMMRRLPPKNLKENLANTVALVPDLVEDLLSSVDQPLEVMRCPETSKEFLLCDYNRDGDSYRSPWTSKYTPPLEDGVQPSEALRALEVAANGAFDQYREQYYEGGVSSCYFWDNEGGFACCIVIKKSTPPKAHIVDEDADPRSATVSGGSWDSIHVVDAQISEGSGKAKYKLTTSILLSLASSCEAQAHASDMSGNLTRAMEREKPYSATDPLSHIGNIGEMVEEMEGRMWDSLKEVYFGKTRDVISRARTGVDPGKTMQMNLMAEMAKKRGGAQM